MERNLRQSVFLIGNKVLHGPFYFLFEGMLPYRAVLLGTDTATEGQATIGMHH